VLPLPLDEHLGLERRVERFSFQQLISEQHESISLHSGLPTAAFSGAAFQAPSASESGAVEGCSNPAFLPNVRSITAA
jgi:hypothetical protein